MRVITSHHVVTIMLKINLRDIEMIRLVDENEARKRNLYHLKVFLTKYLLQKGEKSNFTEENPNRHTLQEVIKVTTTRNRTNQTKCATQEAAVVITVSGPKYLPQMEGLSNSDMKPRQD